MTADLRARIVAIMEEFDRNYEDARDGMIEARRRGDDLIAHEEYGRALFAAEVVARLQALLSEARE